MHLELGLGSEDTSLLCSDGSSVPAFFVRIGDSFYSKAANRSDLQSAIQTCENTDGFLVKMESKEQWDKVFNYATGKRCNFIPSRLSMLC